MFKRVYSETEISSLNKYCTNGKSGEVSRTLSTSEGHK